MENQTIGLVITAAGRTGVLHQLTGVIQPVVRENLVFRKVGYLVGRGTVKRLLPDVKNAVATVKVSQGLAIRCPANDLIVREGKGKDL